MSVDQSRDCKLWWKRIHLQSKLQELCKRSKNEDLIFAIECLEKGAHPKYKEPEINWDRVSYDSNPEKFVPPEILYPSVQKLRDKMARIQKENQEKLAKGEELEMDD
jgi:hypothetical protein